MSDEPIHDSNEVIEAAAWLAELQTAVSETVSGVLLRAARPVPVPASSAKVTSSPGALVGYAIRNMLGTAQAVLIRERDANGDVVIPIVLAAFGTTVEWFGSGIHFTDGIYVESAPGAITGSVFLRGPE